MATTQHNTEESIDVQSLVDALHNDDDGCMQALQKLGELASEKEGKKFTFKRWSQELSVSLRLKGLIPKLVELCVSNEKGGSTSIAALHVCYASTCTDEPNFSVMLIKENVIRRLMRLTNIPLTLSSKEAEQLAMAMRLLSAVSQDVPAALEDLFVCGHMAQIARAIDCHDHENFALVQGPCDSIMTNASDHKKYRERIMDLGCIPSLVKLSIVNHDFFETLQNLSRSESLHNALQDASLLDAVLKAGQDLPMAAFIAIAHVYGSHDDQGGPAARFLSSQDVSMKLMGMLDATLENGDGCYQGKEYSLEEAAHAAKSLSYSGWLAERMVKAGLVPMLVELLKTSEQDEEAVMHATGALLSLSNSEHLRASLTKAGVPDAACMYVEHPDVKIRDAAKGCLLQLGVLNDEAATHANQLLDAADSETKYDVFLSHKRTDAKDFARALYNLLVLRGVTAFLDFEYQEELQLEGGLSKLVTSCRNFVFVLTDNVLSSKWCLQELEAAVDNKINIIIVVKEGSRWKDEQGNKSSPFPGPNIIDELPEKLKPVFSKKAIHHSDEYYSSFIDMLMKKVKKLPPEDPGTRANALDQAKQQQPAALPASTPQTLQPPTSAGQPFLSQPSVPPVALGSGAAGHPQFVQPGLLPAGAMPHAAVAPGALYGGGNAEVLSSLAHLHQSLDMRRDLAAVASELPRIRQEQQQLRTDMMLELQQLRQEQQQLRADLLGEVRKSRQATADADAQMIEAQEGTARSVLGLQNRLASSLTLQQQTPLQPPLASLPLSSIPYAGYPYAPTGFPHAMNAMPSPASMFSSSMQVAGGGGFRRQPSGGRLEGDWEVPGVLDSSQQQGMGQQVFGQQQQQQQPMPQRAAAGSLPPLVQGEGFARSRGVALGGAGRGRAQGHR